MAAIIQGLNKFVQDRVEALGSRTYFISRFPPGTDPSRWPEKIRVRKYFEYNYAGFIRDAAPDVQALTTIGTRGFFFGDSNLITSGHYSVEKVIVRGAEPQYIDAIPLFSIARGRFISAFDQVHTRPVVVLGAGDSHYRNQFDRIAGGWNRRHEYHADLGDRTHSGNWRAQGHWRPPGRCPVAIFAGGRGAYTGWGHNRHPDRRGSLRNRADSCAIDSRNSVLLVGDDWICNLRRCGPVLWLLSGKPGG